MRSVLVAVLAGGMLSCTSEATWRGDSSFTEEERGEIERGAAWLHHMAGQEPPVIAWETLGDDRFRTIRRNDHPTAERMGECTAEDEIFLPSGGGAVTQSAGLAAHEFAHCILGFKDDPGSVGLMGQGVWRGLIWSDAEEAQCRAHPGVCHR